jgi:hypothetical protein
MSDKPKPPVALAAPGKTLWCEVVEKYDLRADELVALEFACSARDMESEFRKAWTDLGRPYMSRGSMGQEVEHPLIGSIDKQRKTRNALWRQLKLPDAEDGAGESNQHRAAAQSKWAKRA